MCNVLPGMGSLKGSVTFITEARGGALSFPGFNGDSPGPHVGQHKTLISVFLSAEDSANRAAPACQVITHSSVFRVVQFSGYSLKE